MRKIKFKAKKINTDIWVIGNLLKYDDLSLIEYKRDTISESYEKVQVDSKTISEFTGLYDKNGDEIYENDILLKETEDFLLYGDKSVVEFYNGTFCITILYDMTTISLHDYENSYKPLSDDNIEKCSWLKDFEKIGNRFDNGDLLIK